MTPKAEQILKYLHKKFPDMLFAWQDMEIMRNEMPWTLIASFRANPNKTATMIFGMDGNGIATVVPERIAYDNIPRLISRLKGSVDH